MATSLAFAFLTFVLWCVGMAGLVFWREKINLHAFVLGATVMAFLGVWIALATR